MESISLFAGSRVNQSTRYRFTEPADEDDELCAGNDASETKGVRRRRQPREMLTLAELGALPWFGWMFVYAFVLFCFSVARCLTLQDLVGMYGSPQDYTPGFKIAALTLGFLEDFVCATYFTGTLWLFDTLKLEALNRFGPSEFVKRVVGDFTTYVVSWLLFFVMMAPFVADMLLVVNRDMRFSFELLATLIREREYLSAAPISSEEIYRGYQFGAMLVMVSTLFAFVRLWATWADLAQWNPTHLVAEVSSGKSVKGAKYVGLALEEGADSAESTSSSEKDTLNKFSFASFERKHVLAIAVVLTCTMIMPIAVVTIGSMCSPLVVYCGLNATLNELFAHSLQPTAPDGTFVNEFGDRPWVEMYIHRTERHKLFGADSLYRRTTGFRGELAFDVEVSKENPPNVLVLGVESFRYQDSRYLVGEEDPSNLFKGTNTTITPSFDRWAKRGVALRNIWSSTPTSRSLESLIFAQVPYQSNVDTAITGGRNGTELSGLPQLFLAKGYETFFTTGSKITLDNWDIFLPTHGYENVWNNHNIAKFAEADYNISRDDWYGDAHRGFNWGVHDDLSFQILGDLLMNKTKEQSESVASGKPKKPVFVTHYTISSHEPYKRRPTWYANATKPDFSAFYEGQKYAENIKNYLEMRHFTDMELGKFMDRMEKEGVLNDTIVVIMGDHGQAPEAEMKNTHEESVTRVPAAIIAEGRLGASVGLVLEDAAEQYDILNTLADITGLPEEGFIQTGVGRSLKRKVPFGERVVFSNDPLRKMSVTTA
ncbi:sulfatase-like protein [Phytophthora cinnamomi]|uniref:sulfatase-like protein n=1 Tax=Phytophthora cinnamomi TaxID=4785 RepID=UPI003559CA3B|nr:sulfatase-like protein [Phytophthora cinnamomi]